MRDDYWQLIDTTVTEPESTSYEDGAPGFATYQATETTHSATHGQKWYDYEANDYTPALEVTWTATCSAPFNVLHENEELVLALTRGITNCWEASYFTPDERESLKFGSTASVYFEERGVTVTSAAGVYGDAYRPGWIEEYDAHLTVPTVPLYLPLLPEGPWKAFLLPFADIGV